MAGLDVVVDQARVASRGVEALSFVLEEYPEEHRPNREANERQALRCFIPRVETARTFPCLPCVCRHSEPLCNEFHWQPHERRNLSPSARCVPYGCTGSN